MTALACRVLPIACLAFVGCLRLPAKVCLTPPYDAPAGFSETYHRALARREPVLRPGVEPLPPSAVGIISVDPVAAGPAAVEPIDW